jgi:hypothetical protein
MPQNLLLTEAGPPSGMCATWLQGLVLGPEAGG